MNKIAVITTHPIQYNAPLFKLLALQPNTIVKVFYTWGAAVLENKFDPGFGKQVKWDIPLLEGYEYEFIENVSVRPGSHHKHGIDNPNIISRVEVFDPTALLVFGWNFKSHLKCLRYFKGRIPVFFRGDSTLLNEKTGFKTIARRWYLKRVYKNVDYALYVGENNKQYFLKHGLKPNQLIHAPHTVDNSRFTQPDDEYSNKAKLWKAKLGILPGEITVLYAGKLEPVKNPSFLLQLATYFKGLPVKIIIVGNGPLEKELKQNATGNEQVIFIDFQNQSLMPVVYRLGDIFIMCSLSETWGLGANEAMASGCVLVLSDKVGGAPDLVTDENGMIFSLSTPENCAAFIKQFITDKNKLAIMKAASRKISDRYSYQNVIHPFLSVLNTIHNGYTDN